MKLIIMAFGAFKVRKTSSASLRPVIAFQNMTPTKAHAYPHLSPGRSYIRNRYRLEENIRWQE